MTDYRYSFSVFVESIKNKHPLEILRTANNEIQAVKRASFGRKGAVKTRAAGSIDYVAAIRALMFYVQNAGLVRPGSLSYEQFLILRPLCEAQVDSGMFSEKARALFE